MCAGRDPPYECDYGFVGGEDDICVEYVPPGSAPAVPPVETPTTPPVTPTPPPPPASTPCGGGGQPVCAGDNLIGVPPPFLCFAWLPLR